MRRFRKYITGACALALLTATAALLPGCGSTSNTDSAHIRVVDAATNAGTANVLVNGAAAHGDQTYFMASPYLFIKPGTYPLSETTTTPVPTGAAATPTQISMTSGQPYTAFLVGRADLAGPEYLKVIAASDAHSTSPNTAAVRVVNAAADAGAVNIQISSGSGAPTTLTAVPYGVSLDPADPATPIYPYNALAPGTLSFTITRASDGTPITPATTSISVSGGSAYTIVLTEPSAGTTPTYDLKAITD